MCYDATSSITNFGIVSVLAAYLAYTGDNTDKHIALFFFAVIQIQLAEYLMWIDQDCGLVNKYATYYGLWVLFMQPLVSVWGGYWFQTTKLSLNAMLLLTLLFVIPFGQNIVNYTMSPGKKCSRSRNGHLHWDFQGDKKMVTWYGIMYFVLLFLPWLFVKDWRKGIVMLGLLVTSFLYHYLRHPESWMSLWCYITRNMMIIYVMIALWWKYRKN